MSILNSKAIAAEVLHTFVGCIGLVLVSPVTSLISAVLYTTGRKHNTTPENPLVLNKSREPIDTRAVANSHKADGGMIINREEELDTLKFAEALITLADLDIVHSTNPHHLVGSIPLIPKSLCYLL